jgi:hypothetical protein
MGQARSLKKCWNKEMAMRILKKYSEKINGILSTFDRMIIRGYIRSLMYDTGRYFYLSQQKVLLKNFAQFTSDISENIKSHGKALAQRYGRPYIYLQSPTTDKEDYAKTIMNKDNITDGLICILATLEMCSSVRIQKNPIKKKLELVKAPRKCLHLYYYFNDAILGFMHVRIQTWLPFTIQIYINGREVLAKKMAKSNIDYKCYDNSFVDISDLPKAQKLAKSIERKNWKFTFNHFAKFVNPHLSRLQQIFSHGYYWSIAQCEFATDVMFDRRQSLELVYPDIVEHASRCFNADDVLGFLGKKYHGLFKGELTTDRKRRPQGYRVKHRVKNNSIKMYDKWNILRIETTINNPTSFKVYRQVIRKGSKIRAWVRMGKSIMNLFYLAQIGLKANKRYLDKLADIPITAHLISNMEQLCKPIVLKNRRYSGFNPLSRESSCVFLAILDGAHNINGFSNKDLRKLLFNSKRNDPKISSQITRLLSKFRAHQLIAKIPRSFRYKVTDKGHSLMSCSLRIKKIEYPLLMAA